MDTTTPQPGSARDTSKYRPKGPKPTTAQRIAATKSPCDMPPPNKGGAKAQQSPAITSLMQQVTRSPDDEMPDNLPQRIDCTDLPAAIAGLDRRSQLILVCIAAGMRVTDIAELCKVNVETIINWIARHGLRELVSSVSPQMVQSFRATRWQMLEQAALTRAQAKLSEMSGSQAVVAAAIATDKQAAILPQSRESDSAPGDLEAQLTVRFRRK